MTGAEIARRLEVDRRTVRRYVETLREMGIPVEGERGKHGAYSLRRGRKMPPLMFTDEEALGLSLSLLAVRRLGVAGVAPAVESALAKVERVMPVALRERLAPLERAIVWTAPVPAAPPTGETVERLAEAVEVRRRVRLRYRSAGSGETERAVDPYALLQWGGRWYLFAYCRLRGGERLFRLDRALGAETLEETFERPSGLETPEAVLGAVANSHPPWEVEVLLETNMERAREMVPTMLASLEETDRGVLLRSTAPDLGGMARVLSGLFCPFVVLKPPELREALRRHAREIAALTERTDGVPAPTNHRSPAR
jgi:predicted DNA-binding transcriptional regulator YafY